MKRKQTRKQRRFSRKQTKKQRRRRQRGGGSLPVPAGSVVSVRLDPRDPTSPMVLVDKETYENEVLVDEAT
jgi:hypothetical protein